MFQVTLHMKNETLFSSNDKSKKLKCRLLQFLFGILMVNYKSTTAYKLFEIFLDHKIYFEISVALDGLRL